MPSGSEIHAAVHAIYDAATEPDRWPAALRAIAACSGDVGTVLIWLHDDGRLVTVVSPELEPSQIDYAARWWQEDIRAQRSIERGFHTSIDGMTDRDVVSEEEIRTHPIYTDFLVPHGLGWFAATSVAPDPRLHAVISVQRRFDRPRFTEEELRAVCELGRHVERSLRLSMRLIDRDLTNEGLAAAFSAMNIGVFGLDGLGRITFVNDEGRALIGDGLAISSNRPTPQYRSDREDFQLALHRAVSGVDDHPPRPVLLASSRTEAPLVAHVMPITRTTDPAGSLLARTRALLLVERFAPGGPIDPTVLRDLLGLTLSEARIAALVGNGMTPRDAAGRLGIAEETARTVLKRVFSKTGVSRQSELVALLARLVLR